MVDWLRRKSGADKSAGGAVRPVVRPGIYLEHRWFSPHITLARAVRLRERPNTQTLLGAPFSTEIRTVSLMLSERVGGTLTYTEQFSVAAGDAAR